jgi:hypothetical protein
VSGQPQSNALLAARNITLKQARRAQNRARHTWKLLVEAVKDSWHAAGRVQEAASNGAVNTYKGVYRAARRPVHLLRDRRTELLDQWSWNRTEWRVEREIGEVLGGDGPIIVGPWLAEVGYEILYWIPFLRWVSAAYRLDPSRVTVVSRGGVGAWYEGIAGSYAEMWDHIEPAQFARRNAERLELKQLATSPLEQDIVASVARAHALEAPRVLHPSLMFRLFKLFWSGHRASGFLDAHTRFRLHRAPGVVDRARLPAEYAAVKFYAARSTPDTPEVRRQLRRLLDELSEQMPVVLLDTGLALDDHADYTFAGSSRLMSARDLLEPRTNLAAQTDIIAHAKAYVGTCGSLTWLAPMLGVHTSAVLADPEFLHAHLAVALRAFHRLEGAAPFCPLDLRALRPMRPGGTA